MINSFIQKLSTWVTAKLIISTTIHFFCCLQVWHFWEQLQCVAHSPLIVGMTRALLFSLGTCIVQIQSVWVNFACTKRLFNLSAEAIINARNAHLCARCGILLLKIKQIPFSCRLVKGFTFWGESKINSRCHWRWVLSRWVLSQQRKCKSIGGYVTTPRSIFGCDNCGAWLFVHKVPLTLQEQVKTTKTDKTRFFFAKKRWTCYTTNKCSIKSHFNQPNLVRKNWVWTTSRLLEMYIVQHVETKIVFKFQPTKRLVSTTAKSAKPNATFRIFLLRTKNQQLCCLAVLEHIALQEKRLATTKNHLHFWKKFANHSHPHQKGQIESKYGINLFVSYWWMIWGTYSVFKSIFSISFHSQSFKFIQLTQNHHGLLSLQRRNPVDSRFSTRLCFYCSKWSRPKYNNQLTRNTPSSLAITLVSKTRLLNNLLARVPFTPNQEGTLEMRDEVLSSVGAQDLDTSSYQVSDFEDIEFNWENSQFDMDAVFRPGIDNPFFPTTFDNLSMEGSFENPIVLDEEEDKENAPLSNNTRVCQTHGTSQATKKSPFWNKNRKCSWLRL